MIPKIFYFPIIMLSVFFATSSFATETKYLNLQGMNNLSQGKLENVQIDEQGHMRLAPSTKEIVDTKDLLIQSVDYSKNGIYFGTAQESEIYFYNYKTKKSVNLYKGSGIAISAMALGIDKIYFVESPSNKLFMLDLKTKKTRFLKKIENVDYVWGLQYYDHDLYAITGGSANLYKINLKSKKFEQETLFTAKQEDHFITLKVEKGKAYLGGEGFGGLYEVDVKTKKTKTLYTTYEGEISDIFIDHKSHKIYFSTSSKEPKTVSNDFDYTDTLQLQDLTYKMAMSKNLDQEMQLKSLALLKQLKEGSSGEDTQKTLAVKNSLYCYSQKKIKKLITLDNMSLDSVTKDDKGNLFIGASQGNIYKYNEKNSQLSLFSNVDNEDVVAINNFNGELYFLTSNLAKLYSMNVKLPSSGTYTSQAVDLTALSTIGKMTIHSEQSMNGQVQVFMRGGQTKNIDNNWTKWQGPFEEANPQKRPSLKDVRFIQYKVKILGKNGKTPIFSSLVNPYISENKEPSISLFNVYYDRSKPTNPSYALTLQWKAQDGNNDELSYSIYFKAKKDLQWQFLGETASTQNKLTVDTRLLPDEVYQFKITVSDKLSNGQKMIATKSQISKDIVVDNTSPVISIDSVKSISSKNVLIKGHVTDKTSLIAKAYYRVGTDADNWSFIAPKSGIYDDKNEEFEITVPKEKLKKNLENIVFIRVFDVNLNQIAYCVKLDSTGKQI